MIKEVAKMDRRIFDIGSGKYRFDKKTLNQFIEEARTRESASVPGGGAATAGGTGASTDREIQGIFEEVTSLYGDYVRCQSMDLLVKLKCRLEDFSIRYNSHVLAAEVLQINSCLPYEHRVACVRKEIP
jgi:hypothetical protein